LQDICSYPNAELITEVLSNEEFFATLAKCKYLALPYDAKSYRWGGSSILYYASDLLIPVITYENLPISAEIAEFECGILVNSVKEIPRKFNFLNHDDLVKGIRKFNGARNSYNLELFDIPNNIREF
jgi:hypothetical protein